MTSATQEAPVDDLLTSHIEDLESLVRGWRKYAAESNAADDMSRDAGFISALKTCAGQLDETITRLRESAEV